MNTSKDIQKEKANSDLRGLNSIGKRIAWCRVQLKISQKKVSIETGIPISSYASREYGARTYYHEEYRALAEYFNKKWKERFQINFPVFNGAEIREVKTMWLMFGERND